MLSPSSGDFTVVRELDTKDARGPTRTRQRRRSLRGRYLMVWYRLRQGRSDFEIPSTPSAVHPKQAPKKIFWNEGRRE